MGMKGPHGIYQWCLATQGWVFLTKKHLVMGHSTPWYCLWRKNWGKMYWKSWTSWFGFSQYVSHAQFLKIIGCPYDH
jgi:hypothetical protein